MQILVCGDDWRGGTLNGRITEFLQGQEGIAVKKELFPDDANLPPLDACISTGTYFGNACSGYDLDLWLEENIIKNKIPLVLIDTEPTIKGKLGSAAQLVFNLNEVANEMLDASKASPNLDKILDFLRSVTKPSC